MTTAAPALEAFDRQVEALVQGEPREETAAIRDLVAPPRERARRVAVGAQEDGKLPFLLVLTREVVAIEAGMGRTAVAGRDTPGFVDRTFEEGALERFVATLDLPDPRAYLLLDVERGEEFCGVAPRDALAEISRRGRSPLTIEEGISLIRVAPPMLEKNKCFSLGGSRCGDRRVPALWISNRTPK